jgi:hypothetical protein
MNKYLRKRIFKLERNSLKLELGLSQTDSYGLSTLVRGNTTDTLQNSQQRTDQRSDYSGVGTLILEQGHGKHQRIPDDTSGADSNDEAVR